MDEKITDAELMKDAQRRKKLQDKETQESGWWYVALVAIGLLLAWLLTSYINYANAII